MSLYVPAHFATDDRDAMARLMHDHPFATVITFAGGELHVSHVPLLHVAEGGPHGTLIGHFARANPHWRHAEGVASLVVFQGPHAYVSPSWYTAPERMVPTWNYVAVHAHGALAPIADAIEARGVLDALVERFEGGRAVPWRLTMPAPQRDAMVGAIVAFRIPIDRLEGKFKLSQNRSAEDRARVAQALRAEGYAEATATAEWMARHADVKAPPP
ncbi:MAG: FMN-binding negative transcriptional regulator [Burkholderiales bacterium]